MDKNKCTSCGEAPKKCSCKNKDFTKAVVEINNPEMLVLFRKVVIPASIGDEEAFPPAIGKYRNVLLHYEINKHSYLYSSDGIPTLISADVPQEVLDRIEDLETGLAQEIRDREDADLVLQGEIDDLRNSPDVIDIVGTYADLQAYDTSGLTDKDIIRVLQDETKDGASTYYRWDSANNTWDFIGALGPFFTVFYRNNAEPGTTNQHIYKDIDFTTAASAYDIDSAAKNGFVVLCSIDQGSLTDYWTFSLISVYKDNGYYQFEFIERDFLWEYEADNSSSTTFTRNTKQYQNKLTAGQNITITGNTISAVDTTYTAGSNITIESNVISATDTTYTAGNGLELNGTEFSVDPEVVATQEDLYDKADVIKDTVSDSVVELVDGGNDMPIVSLSIGIDPTQAGTGTPDPTNVRAISGNNNATLTIAYGTENPIKDIGFSQSGTGDPTPTNIRPITPGASFTLGDNTKVDVYGGRLDLANKTLTVTHYYYELTGSTAAENWLSQYSGANSAFYTILADLPMAEESSMTGDFSHFTRANVSSSNTIYGARVYTYSSTTRILLRYANQPADAAGFITQLGDWAAADTPLQIVYPLATPVVYNLSNKQILEILESMGESASYTVSFSGNPGTVYGGDFNFTTGELTVTHGIATFNGSESWALLSTSPAFYRTLSTMKVGEWYSDPRTLCDTFPKINDSASVGFQIGAAGSKIIYARNMQTYLGISTADDFRNWLSTHPVTITYPLDTPLTYQLTTTELETALGYNYLSADTGGVTLTYRADTKLYIDSNIQDESEGLSSKFYYLGTCSSNASALTKVVDCEGYVLKPGNHITVKFTNGNSYNGQAQLDVNNTGAKNLITSTGTASTATNAQYAWSAGEYVDFVYDGTQYVTTNGGIATLTYYGVTKLSDSLTSAYNSFASTPSAINTALQNIVTGAPVYSSSATYEVGDKVRYANNVYECTTAITTAEAWNAEHWIVVDDLQTQIDAIHIDPADYFTAGETVTGTGSTLTINNTMNSKLDDIQLLGDTTQQTYSGKNLFDGILELGIINGNTGQNDPSANFVRCKDYIPVEELTNYTISSTTSEIENFLIYEYKSDYTYNLANNVVVPKGSHWQTKADTKYIRFRPGYASSDTTMKFQVEKGTTPTAYEPYVGGIPAPNPDYPQTVNVVTGEQTITISDGDSQSQTYTVDLGSVELCKIGNYQDKIYKSGDDWYVHKEIGTQTVNGSETWSITREKTDYIYYQTTAYTLYPQSDSDVAAPVMSTQFITQPGAVAYDSNISTCLALNISGYIRINVPKTSFPDATSVETHFTSNPMDVYYALVTPTDTKITDADLLSDLNTLYNAMSYDEQTSFTVTSTNLPAILQVAAYRKSLEGTIGAINNAASSGNFSLADQQKLDGIEAGAEVNVQADWAQSNNTEDDYIKNKPTIPTITLQTTDPGEGATLAANSFIGVYDA